MKFWGAGLSELTEGNNNSDELFVVLWVNVDMYYKTAQCMPLQCSNSVTPSHFIMTNYLFSTNEWNALQKWKSWWKPTANFGQNEKQ